MYIIFFFFTIDKRKQTKSAHNGSKEECTQITNLCEKERIEKQRKTEHVAMTKGQHNGQLAKSCLSKTVWKPCSHTHTHTDR